MFGLLLVLQAHSSLLGGARIQKALTYGGVGAVWAFVGFLNTRAETGESFSFRKASQPVLIGVIAGVILSVNDQPLSVENLGQAEMIAVPLFNQILNGLKNSQGSTSSGGSS